MGAPSPHDEVAFFHFQLRALEHTQRMRDVMERKVETLRTTRQTAELLSSSALAQTAHKALQTYHDAAAARSSSESLPMSS